CARELHGDRPRVEHGVAVPDALVADEADAHHEVVSYALADAADNAKRQAETVRERAAVGVLARVQAREERRERVRVRHVELDPVEAAFARARGSGAVSLD